MISGTVYFSKPLGYWRVRFEIDSQAIDTELVRFSKSYPSNDIGVPDELYSVLKAFLSDLIEAQNTFGRNANLLEVPGDLCK